MNPARSAIGWTLPDALGVTRGDVVAFVGAGGKTAALFGLARALAARNWQVVVTVTTHLGREQSSLAPCHLVWVDSEKFGGQLRTALATASIVLVTGPPTEGGLRWGGVPAEWVAQAAGTQGVDVVLVEADGARGLSLKAPAPHEPMIPPGTTLLVPVAAADAVGRPLAEAAHRPEQVTRLTGLTSAEPITPTTVGTVLAHPEGGLRGLPPEARARVLINKVENPAALAIGREIADTILRAHSPTAQAIEGVVLGAAGTNQPVGELRRRVAAVVLAAGRSLRMEGVTPKLLLPWDDVPVVRRVVETAAACPGLVGPMHVVVGAYRDEIADALAGTEARIIFNPDYEDGEMLSSLQVGVRALPSGISACLVLLGDQPWLAREVMGDVLTGYAGWPVELVAPTYGGRRGHPVLIGRRYWPELLGLPLGAAPRDLLGRHQDELITVPVETDAILLDMDTWEEYEQALQAWKLLAPSSGEQGKA